jgi:hypothetical protein
MSTKKVTSENTATVPAPRLTPQQEAERALRLAESDLRAFGAWLRDFDKTAIYAGLFQSTPPLKLSIIEEDDETVTVDYGFGRRVQLAKSRLNSGKLILERGTRFAYGRDHGARSKVFGAELEKAHKRAIKQMATWATAKEAS